GARAAWGGLGAGGDRHVGDAGRGGDGRYDHNVAAEVSRGRGLRERAAGLEAGPDLVPGRRVADRLANLAAALARHPGLGQGRERDRDGVPRPDGRAPPGAGGAEADAEEEEDG